MRFLPFETVIIYTPLTKEDTISMLRSNIEREKTFRFWNKSDTKAFEGHLTGDEFEIKRIISYKNSFRPTIKGRIDGFGTGTRLTINMRLHTAVMIFIAIWFGIVGLSFIAGLSSSEDSSGIFLFPLGMLLFGYGLTMAGYLFEAYRAKEILSDITKGQIVRNAR